MRTSGVLGVALVAAVLLAPGVARGDAAACLKASGKAGARCLARYAGAIEKCRRGADAACEDALRSPGGSLEQALAAVEAPIRAACDAEGAETLGYWDADDVVLRVAEACSDFAEDHVELAFADELASLDADGLACQRVVAGQLAGLRAKGVLEYGARCHLPSFRGKGCNRERRDARLERRRRAAQAKILKRCGAGFDALGLVEPEVGGTEDRIAELAVRVAARARHYAQRVYPPNDLGPTAGFGAHPVGVRTLQLADPSRPDLSDPMLPRPLTVEVYYPADAAAVAGVPRDVVQVLGIEITETPAYRDVAIAPGPFPLVLFSHGNGGIRFQSFFFAAHLASHGFVVATPDHHGNTFLDALGGIEDADPAVNRPLDMSFLIDELTAFTGEPGHFLEGAIDPQKIGVSGHSFGGYTALALAGGAFGLGTFSDARVKAILPQAPAAWFFEDAFFAGITLPTLVVGGTLDETTPFPANQQHPFDVLPSGAAFVGLAELAEAGHFTFSDFCEVPRELLGFLGGFDEACEPRHLAWRHAHDIVNYLSLNFFDAILNGNADALGRLGPAAVGEIESLRVETK